MECVVLGVRGRRRRFAPSDGAVDTIEPGQGDGDMVAVVMRALLAAGITACVSAAAVVGYLSIAGGSEQENPERGQVVVRPSVDPPAPLLVVQRGTGN